MAQGKIVPMGRTTTVQAPALNPGESGLVKTIGVEEGQHVEAGQVLIELDSTETGADRQKLRKNGVRVEFSEFRGGVAANKGESRGAGSDGTRMPRTRVKDGCYDDATLHREILL